MYMNSPDIYRVSFMGFSQSFLQSSFDAIGGTRCGETGPSFRSYHVSFSQDGHVITPKSNINTFSMLSCSY